MINRILLWMRIKRDYSGLVGVALVGLYLGFIYHPKPTLMLLGVGALVIVVHDRIVARHPPQIKIYTNRRGEPLTLGPDDTAIQCQRCLGWFRASYTNPDRRICLPCVDAEWEARWTAEETAAEAQRQERLGWGQRAGGPTRTPPGATSSGTVPGGGTMVDCVGGATPKPKKVSS